MFNGEQVIKSEDLKTLDTTENLIIKSKDNSIETFQKYRDVVKKSAFGAEFVVLGIENQMNVHYTMAVRNMLYDAINYTNQVSDISKLHSKNKDLSGDEFLSKFSRTDKLMPTITLVVYYGDNQWDGSIDLYSMLDFPNEKSEIIKRFVPNYKINLLSVNNIEDIKNYKTGLRELFGVIKNEKNGKELKKYIETNKDRFSNLDEDTYNAIKVFVDIDKYKIEENSIKNEKGGINMSQALDDIYNDAMEEGKIQVVRNMLKLNMDIDVISKVADLPKDKVLEIKSNLK